MPATCATCTSLVHSKFPGWREVSLQTEVQVGYEHLDVRSNTRMPRLSTEHRLGVSLPRASLAVLPAYLGSSTRRKTGGAQRIAAAQSEGAPAGERVLCVRGPALPQVQRTRSFSRCPAAGVLTRRGARLLGWTLTSPTWAASCCTLAASRHMCKATSP